MNLLSDDYKEQLVKLHNTQVWGASGYSHVSEVLKFKRELKAKTILDFGCGRGTLKPNLLKKDSSINEIDIREYDPAIEGKSILPLPADLLVANDVLEHIEFNLLDETLLYIRSLSIKGAYFTIALTLSKVSLPDGRNAHLIIKSKEWWLGKLRLANFKIQKAEMRKGLWVWAK